MVICSITVIGQNISNKGKEFWVGYGHHQFMEQGTNAQDMVLYLSAEDQPATVTVSIDSSGTLPGTGWRKTYLIPAFTVISSAIIPKGTVDAPTPADANYDARLYTDPPPAGNGGAGLFRRKGIHIESNVPIVAYAHIYGSASSGATMLIPVEAWGYSYVSLNSKQSYASNCYNWMYVVASKDNTVIEVTPLVKTRAQNLTGLSPNGAKLITLMKGQIYQVIGANNGSDANGNGGSDAAGQELSGTRVRSLAGITGDCNPIAVFAGSSRTSNPTTCGSGGGDNDNQQLFPQHAWGKRYLTAPFSRSTNANLNTINSYKIAVKDLTTVVKRNGNALPRSTTGVYLIEGSSTGEYFEADKPIMVAQFMTGGACLGGGNGDPEMVVLSPIEQAIKQVGFYRNSVEGITVNYLTLIVPSAGLTSLRIDNSATFDYTYDHPKLAGYKVVVKRWAITPSSLGSQAIVKCDSAFVGITYGLGSVESYAYNAGTFLNNLNALSDIHNVPDTTNGGTGSHLFNCVKTPVKLSVLMRYEPTKLVWKLSALGNVVTPNADFTMDPASNYFKDTIVIAGIKYYRYTLPADYVFNNAGTYNISIRSTSLTLENCNNTEDLQITVVVKPKPNIDFTMSPIGCSKDSVYFSGPAATAGNTYIIGQWKWAFSNTLTDSTQNSRQIFTAGTNTAKLYIASTEGCSADTTKSFTVAPPPIASVDAVPSTVCLGQSITLTGTSSYSGPTPINAWYWDLNNGHVLNNTNNNSVLVNYTNPGTYTVKYVVKASALCISDTAIKIVTVSPKALISFTYPLGCLPPSGLAQFTASATDIGGQPITSYNWNFGDPNSGATNTSTAQNPTYTYTTFGNYTVTLNVVTNTGCAGDTSVTISMNVQPTTGYGSLSPVCLKQGIISVASGSVTNGVPGSAYYKGPGTDSSGNFNPAIAGVGTHKILYIFTSNGNCIDTAESSIVVYPLPAKPVVTSPVTYCQNSTASPLIATATAGNTLTWYDNPALSGGSTTAPTPSTTTVGNFYYYVTQTSSTGCKSDTSIITVTITPGIGGNTISANQILCSAGATVAPLASPGSPAGGTGSFSYQWQQTVNGGANWTNIGGATAASFDPGPVYSTTVYRRMVISGLCTSYSNEVTITIVGGFSNTGISGDQVICNGTTPALLNGQPATGGGTIGYQWETSSDGISWINIAGATAEDYQPSLLSATTYYRRRVSNSTCSAMSSPVQIMVNAKPSGSITAASVICAYDAATVTFTASAGTAPFNVLLTITNPGGATSTVKQSVSNNGPATINVIPPNSPAGNYTIVITSITDNNGCTSTAGFTALTIEVNPKPVLTVSIDTAICNGTSATLIASGAATYTWSPALGLSSTSGISVTATPTTTTTYTVTGSANGCNAAPANVTVTVNPVPSKPSVTTSYSYCQNSAASSLSATATSGNALAWYSNAALTGGVATAPTPSTATAGIFYYYVTQKNGSGCVSDTSTITVTVSAAITGNTIASSQTLCSTGSPTPLFATGNPAGGSGNYTYQWQQSNNGGSTWNSVASATNSTYDPGTLSATATYRRIVTSGLCSHTSNTVTITIVGTFNNTGIAGTQAICEGSIPSVLDGQSATSGGTISYQWESSTDAITWTNITGATAEDYQPGILAATTYYRRKVSNSACSATSSSVQVTVNAMPRGAISAPSSICSYEAASVSFTANSGTAPFTVQLTITNPAGTTSTINQILSSSGPTAINIIPFNSAPGNYNVALTSITDNFGCNNTTGFTTLTIMVKSRPVITLSADTTICSGSFATLTADGATSYSWAPATGLSSTSGSTVTATPGSTTTYMVTGTANGCDATAATVKVTVNPIPLKPSATTTVSYCHNATASPLNGTASAGNTLTWYHNAALTGGTVSAPTPPTTTAGTFFYFVTQTNSSGCVSDTSRITVVINAVPVANFQIPTAICLTNGQATVTFNNLSSVSSNNTLTYLWSFGDGSASSTLENPVHTYSSAGPFTVQLTTTTSAGCTSDVTKIISRFYDRPVAQFTVSPDTLCQGTQNIFTDLSTAPNSTIQSWKWIFGDGFTSTAKSPVKTYPLPGNYTVQLFVQTPEGCKSDTFSKKVFVYVQPVVDAGPSFVVLQGTAVKFNPKVNDTSTVGFLWTPPGQYLNNPKVLRPTLIAQNSQVYTLTANGLGNCTASDTLSVKVLLPFTIPNAFSPNGDGINDTWQIDNLKDYPGSSVEVFNRYGTPVLSSYGYSSPWSGTLNGKPLPVGVYYYIIDLKNGLNKIAGSITILK